MALPAGSVGQAAWMTWVARGGEAVGGTEMEFIDGDVAGSQ